MGEDALSNEFNGSARNVVQARDIYGGVHIHTGPALPVPRQLPPDVGYFTDREAHLARLDSWLDTRYECTPPAQVVAGIGGVGKTSLVTHWAHQVRSHFPDGDLYVDLRGYHVERATAATDALEQFLRAFDIPGDRIPAGLDARTALYRSLLHNRRMLVVLDNAATVDQIRPLLPSSPTTRVLVTSRSKLTGLATRDGAHRMPLDVLPPERAVELLRRVVGAERVEQDARSAAELARYCGYLPLALRIAAERLVASPHLRPRDLVAELAQARERLDALSTEDDEFATIRAVFSWSYHCLTPDDARMFRLLGLPTGPDISLAAAARLADVPPPRARRILDRLVAAHMLQENSPQRYRLHDLLRVYAAECAENDESAAECQAAVSRLLTWYTHTSNAAARVIAPQLFRSASFLPANLPDGDPACAVFTDRPAALAWSDAERVNLVAAVSQAFEVNEYALAWHLPVILLGFFLVRRPHMEWIATHHVALAAARILHEHDAEIWLQTSIAIAFREIRQYDIALENLHEALIGWREIGRPWGEAWALRDIGRIYREAQGRTEDAIDYFQKAIALHVADGDAWGEAVALSMLALARDSLGSHEQAVRDLNRALALFRDQNDQRCVAGALCDLGLVYGHLGRNQEARKNLEQALAVHQAGGYPYGQARAHERLATVLRRLDQEKKAEEHWHAAIRIFDNLGDPRADDLRGAGHGSGVDDSSGQGS